MEDKSEGASEFKPGETIHPGDAPAPQDPVAPAAAQPAPQAPQPEVTAPVAPQAQAATPQATPQDPVYEQSVERRFDDDPESITWSASEFVDHAKSFDWYLGLGVAAIVSAGALYIFFKDIITSVTPLVAALALGFYARRQPRQLQYRLDSEGITIADKYLPYGMFRSFAIMEEDAFVSIAFLPLKRFGLLTTVYLDPQDEDRIIDLLSDYLPFEPREHDAVDRLMKRM